MIGIARKKRNGELHYCAFEHCCMANKAIPNGELCIKIVYRTEGKKFNTLYLHRDCYIQSILQAWNEAEETLRQKILDRKPRNKGGKVGRPPRFTDPAKQVKYRSLMCLLGYHRKLGHIARVEEVQKEIEVLEL